MRVLQHACKDPHRDRYDLMFFPFIFLSLLPLAGTMSLFDIYMTRTSASKSLSRGVTGRDLTTQSCSAGKSEQALGVLAVLLESFQKMDYDVMMLNPDTIR